MVSLVDIVPQKRTVQLAAGEHELRGLGLRQIANLLLRFPEFRKRLVEGGAPAVDIEVMLLQMPGCVGAIIAEASGQPEAEDAIPETLSLDDMIECLIVIRDLTMPRGAAPLFERLDRLFSGLPAAAPAVVGEDLDMNALKRQSA